MSSRKIQDVTGQVPEAVHTAPIIPNGHIALDIEGKTVVMGPPPGGTMRQIAIILGAEPEGNPALLVMWIKALMYVRSIDGVPVSPPSNKVEAQKLANQLGSYGEDVVMAAFEKYWPIPGREDLPLIKK